MYILALYVCNSQGIQKRSLDPLRLKLQTIVIYHRGIENCPQVLHKGTQCSFLLSTLSGPKRLSFSLNLFYNQDLIRNHLS